MKRLLVVVAVVVLAGGLVAGAVVYTQGRNEFTQAQADLLVRWAKVEAKVKADEARWKSDPLIAPKPGGDAGPVLFQRVNGLTDGLSHSPPPRASITPAHLAQLKEWGTAWPGHAAEVDFATTDLEWLRTIASFGFWDVEGPDSPLTKEPMSASEPVVGFADLIPIAKIRLLQGLSQGDAREAAKEVRALARLCLTSEHLIGAAVGVSLLGSELHAFEAAQRRGHDTTGWVPIAADDAEALRRLVWFAAVPFSVLATGPLAQLEPPVGACLGLREGLWARHVLWSRSADQFADSQARLVSSLERSSCRLQRTRAQWLEPSTDIDLAREVPFGSTWPVRRYLMYRGMVLASPDWLSHYDDDGHAAP